MRKRQQNLGLQSYVMRCSIWYYLHNFKKPKVCNFTKSNTPPWVFFTFFKLYKWYQIKQSIRYNQHKIGNDK